MEALTQVSLNPPPPASDALVAAPYGAAAGAMTSSALQVRQNSFLVANDLTSVQLGVPVLA